MIEKISLHGPVVQPSTEVIDRASDIKEKIEKVSEEKKQEYIVETFISGSPELTPEVLQEIANFFRYTFNNAFPEYVICTDCDIQFPASEVFDTGKEYVDLEVMDAAAGKICCPGCSQQMEAFHNPKKVEQKIQKNLSENACVSILKQEKNETLRGMTFAYFNTFEEVFEREWANEKIYMKQQDMRFERDMGWFLQQINKTLQEKQWNEITRQSEVCCWNCATIHPRSQGLQNMLKLFKGLLNFIEAQNAKQEENKIIVLETRTDSTAHKVLKIAGAIDITDAFDDKGQVFMVGQLHEVAKNFSLSSTDFITRALKNKHLLKSSH